VIGTVKWFNDAKGYGFVSPDGGGKDVFVHISAVTKAQMETLEQGDRITFDLETRKDGKKSAINLRIAS
jgi:cold shock protein